MDIVRGLKASQLFSFLTVGHLQAQLSALSLATPISSTVSTSSPLKTCVVKKWDNHISPLQHYKKNGPKNTSTGYINTKKLRKIEIQA
jgi:hypothetical protein